MSDSILLLMIVVPVAAGLAVLAIRRSLGILREALTVLVTLANLAVAIVLFGQDLTYVRPWAGFGMDFSLRLLTYGKNHSG